MGTDFSEEIMDTINGHASLQNVFRHKNLIMVWRIWNNKTQFLNFLLWEELALPTTSELLHMQFTQELKWCKMMLNLYKIQTYNTLLY